MSHFIGIGIFWIGLNRTDHRCWRLTVNGDNKYTANDICKMIEFLVDNMYVRFGGQLFRQTVGIPMGKNWVPLLADLFLCSYENVARKFYLSYRYIDDHLSYNNKRFLKGVHL